MEQHDPSRRQYVPQNFSAQQTQPLLAPTSGQFANTGPVERFRQSTYLQEPPSTPPSAVRGGDTQQVYGYAQSSPYGTGSAMQAGGMQYGHELQTPEAQRQQAQQYQPYGSNVLYSMGQSQTGASPYEQVPHYRSRTNTASETMGSQFGVPQTAQYYLASQASQPNASAPEIPTQALPSQYAPPDPYTQPGPSTGQPYPNAVLDPSQSGQYSAYVQQGAYSTQLQQSMDQGFERYETQMKTIFTLARDGSLRDVGSHLVDASQYLLGNAEALGLARDQDGSHDSRLRLWEEFNRAWLVTLQRQFDMTQDMMRNNQQPREPQSIMSTQTLERLGQELVRLCDIVEKHGLVDYQIGVAEEEIVDLLLRCISLLEPPEERFDEGAPQTTSSSSAAARGR